jgi:hypothetical protein
MPINGDTTGQDDIQVRLKTTQEECNRLREENERLRAILGIDHSHPGKPVSQAVSVTKPSSIATSEVYTPEKKSRSFEICFMGAKTFLPFGGKERAASLATRLLAAWTGVPSMLRNRKIEREWGARRGYSNH